MFEETLDTLEELPSVFDEDNEFDVELFDESNPIRLANGVHRDFAIDESTFGAERTGAKNKYFL